MGFFNRPTNNPRPPADLFPPQGSQLDTIPAVDDLGLLCIRQWLDEWFRALTNPDNPTLIRLLTTYGEALEANGVRATFAAVQKGIDGGSPGQRPWRWLSLGAAAANAAGEYVTPIKILYFMLQFDSFVRKAIEADDIDGFIEIGIDPPTLHSKWLIAEQAMTATMQIQDEAVHLPDGDLSCDAMMSQAAVILEAAEAQFPDGTVAPQFLIGKPLADGEWADSKSGEFRYGRRIQA
jgi:hypothetical protein